MRSFVGSPLALCLGTAVVFACISPPRAAAQDPSRTANFGSVKLQSGFLPGEFIKQLVAEGKFMVSKAGVQMRITYHPNVTLYWTAGNAQFPLYFYVRSRADTTLLIHLPNGRYVADDDSGGNLNPLITLKNPQSGRYDIWVGTFHPTPASATLHITERKVSMPIPK